MTQTISPPLKWHGGKHYLASKIIALMPPHVHYVEAFAGGLSVMLAKDPEGVSEVANDLNGWLTNFWNVLADPDRFATFKRILQAVPFSQPSFAESMRIVASSMVPSDTDTIRAAVHFFVACRQSMAGRMESFAPLSRNRTRRGMNEQASAWMTAVDGLPAVSERLRRVVVLNMPAAKCIEQQDSSNTLFYLDPPYVPDSRSSPDVYAHEMSIAEHGELLGVINSVNGKVMLSGYDNNLYASNLNGWTRHEFDLPNNSASGETKQRKTEVLWCNF
jgi:DNA adenine methylase